MNSGAVYILTNAKRSVLYIGVTNDLERRVLEHKQGFIPGFTKQYQCKYLMYYEEYPLITDAIDREKQLKRWHSKWKWDLIKEDNPLLKDLAEDWFTEQDIIAAE